MDPTALRIASVLAVFATSLEPAVAALHPHESVATAAGKLLQDRSGPSVHTRAFTTRGAAGEWLESMPDGTSIADAVPLAVTNAPGRSGGESGALANASVEKSLTDADEALPDGTPPGFLFFFGGLLALGVLAGQRTRSRKKLAPLVEPLQADTVDATAERAQTIRPKILGFPPTAYHNRGLRALAEDSRSKEAIH